MGLSLTANMCFIAVTIRHVSILIIYSWEPNKITMLIETKKAEQQVGMKTGPEPNHGGTHSSETEALGFEENNIRQPSLLFPKLMKYGRSSNEATIEKI